MDKKIWHMKGQRVTPSQAIKWLKGVYFLTSDNPKITDPNTPFRVRVGKGDGKQGIFSRIGSHQSSNFDRLYYTVITKLNSVGAYDNNKTPLQLEREIHKLFKEEYEIPHKDSWYQFKSLQQFLTVMQMNFHTQELILENDAVEMCNWSELLNEYKYTQTSLSYGIMTDPHREKYPAPFEWFCTNPVEKKEMRGIVFKNGVVYEEYFEDSLETSKQYQEILGGYWYCKSTQVLNGDMEWEDIVIIAKEQDEITSETPFMKLPQNKHYNYPATPVGDTMIVLGEDKYYNERSLKNSLIYYNYFLDFPCYNFTMNFVGSTKPSIKLRYIPYDEELTEEGKEFYNNIEKKMKEMVA